MSDKVFFDTNVLVYAFDDHDPQKQEQARELIQLHGSSGSLVLSTQVLQEFYVVATGKLKKAIPRKMAEEVIQDLASFSLVQVDKNLIIAAIQRHQEEHLSFWDCLIVQAALQAQCKFLMTEDMQDGYRIKELTIQNPFTKVSA